MSQNTSATAPETAHRLPCRGCLPDCPNYATCDGKPWRADKARRDTSGAKPHTGA